MLLQTQVKVLLVTELGILSVGLINLYQETPTKFIFREGHKIQSVLTLFKMYFLCSITDCVQLRLKDVSLAHVF
jgi:hypothetical protein